MVFIGIGNFDFDNIDDLKKTNFIVKNSFGEKSKEIQFNLLILINLMEMLINYYKFKNVKR